ncbi:hypothetical protein HanRHA438_Chr04g0199041 [Helianthus annuus]|nr:hypothetical protein HanRHA438_Chr04g0199041 [Helianthus annuus]
MEKSETGHYLPLKKYISTYPRDSRSSRLLCSTRSTKKVHMSIFTRRHKSAFTILVFSNIHRSQDGYSCLHILQSQSSFYSLCRTERRACINHLNVNIYIHIYIERKVNIQKGLSYFTYATLVTVGSGV